MLTYPRWQYIVILLVLAFGVIYALPNAYPQDPSVQVTADRGGIVDESLRTRVAEQLQQAGVTPQAIDLAEDSLLVRLDDPDEQGRAADVLRPVLGDDYVVALSLASTVPAWLQSLGADAMPLGLDLRGGVHFTMQVDQQAALDKRMDATTEDLRVVLRDKRVRYQSVTRRPGSSEVTVTLADEADADRARSAIFESDPTLQLSGSGNTLTVRVSDSELSQITADAIEQNIGTLRNRINALGVAEPVIQRQGTDRIVVQLPGVQDAAQANRIVGATATLDYRAALDGNAYDAIASGNIPPDARVYYRKEIGPDGNPIPILLSRRVIATGDQLVHAA